jgi:beta-N-acetylhexosaminidase
MTNAHVPRDPAVLSIRERLAQLMVVRIGSDIPPVRTADDDAGRIAALLTECPVGGLLLFNGRAATTPAALADLQARSRIPLLVMADVERGAGQQLRPWPILPHAAAFDRLGAGAVAAVREFGELTAATARRAGVHVVNAPVADVHSDPGNPIIATRAFSQDPQRAGELAAAFVAGCAAGGCLAAAKHFPGHGDTREDSHDSLPAVAATAEMLRSRELVPFRTVVAAGVPLVMTAHVRYPALDPGPSPATLSQPILQGVLRGELAFEGAVVSDSLLMAGVRAQATGEGELCLRAILAGVDILLDVERPAEAVAFLERAVADGRLQTARLDEACGRVLALKRRACDPARGAGSRYATAGVAELHEATRCLADTVARAAVEIHDPRGLLPLDAARPLTAVLINHYRSHIDPPRPPLEAALRQGFSRCDFHELRGDEPAADWAAIEARCLAAEQLLVAIVVKPAAWHRFGLLPAADAWLRSLCGRRPVVLGVLGCLPESGRGAAAILTTSSDVAASQEALAGVMLIGSRAR